MLKEEATDLNRFQLCVKFTKSVVCVVYADTNQN